MIGIQPKIPHPSLSIDPGSFARALWSVSSPLIRGWKICMSSERYNILRFSSVKIYIWLQPTYSCIIHLLATCTDTCTCGEHRKHYVHAFQDYTRQMIHYWKVSNLLRHQWKLWSTHTMIPLRAIVSCYDSSTNAFLIDFYSSYSYATSFICQRPVLRNIWKHLRRLVWLSYIASVVALYLCSSN